MEGVIAVTGFWLFLIILALKKPVMAYLERCKSEKEQALVSRVQQLEGTVATMAKELLQLKEAKLAHDLLELKQEASEIPAIGYDSESLALLTEGLGKVVDEHTVRFERLLPGTTEQVWQYLTQPENLRQWLAAATLDARVGGRIELNFDVDEAPERAQKGATIKGLINQFEQNRALAFSWIDTGSNLESHVSVELAQQGDQTLLVLTHSRLPHERMHEVMAGWHTHLDTLLARLQNAVPPDFIKTFRELVPIYAAVVATFIASTSAAQAAIPREQYQAVQTERAHLLTKYDHKWRDADDLQRQIIKLKHDSSPEVERVMNDLDKQLQDEYRDLHQLELDIRDLDKALL